MKQERNKEKEYDRACIQEILKYHATHGRHELPWRKKITPYKILVSEVMLQQTQVTRVAPKFSLWMKRYPTLNALAHANLEEVLLLWQGLGYQRRAKALLLVAQENASLPKTFDELCKLPGIGRYTASALCAFAYNTFSHPVLETNIRTVLIELFHQGETDIHDGMLYDDLSRLESCAVVQNVGARTWYYALMDFGASLKLQGISHNAKSKHYVKQTPYKGSFRELRAKTLFAITKGETLPQDERLSEVLTVLQKEGYITSTATGYRIKK